VYPGIDRLREVAVLVATAVVSAARRELPGVMAPEVFAQAIEAQLYQPSYPSLSPGDAGLLNEDGP
jgi:hypothetical protein